MAVGGAAIRAGRAFVELFADDTKLVRGLRRASARLKSWGRGVASIGTRLAAASSAVLGPMLGMTKMFASAGDQLHKLSARTGIGVQSLSELKHAAELSGSSLEQVGAAVQRMNRRLGRITAGQGTGSQVEAMEALGLSAERLETMNPEDRLFAIADAMAAMEDSAEAAGLAQRAFGTAVDGLLPLLLEGSDGMRAMMKEARDLGITMDQQDAESAAALTDAWTRLTSVLKSLTIRIGAELAPMLTTIADRIAGVVSPVIDWIKANGDLIVSVFKIAAAASAIGGGLVLLGGAIIGVGALFGGLASILTGIGALFGAIGTAVAAILSPLGLAITAVAGLTAAVLHFSGAGSEMLDWIGRKFGELKDTALAAWKGIGDALAAGDIALAGRVLWATLTMEWQKGVQAVNKLWEDAKWYFFAVWNEATTFLAKAFTGAYATVQRGWVQTVSFMESVWSTFTTTFGNMWNKAQKTAGNLLIGALEKIGVLNEQTAEIAKQDLGRQLDEKIGRRSEADAKRQEEIEAQRRKDLAAINQEERDANAVLEQDKKRYYGELNRQYDKDLAAAQKSVDQAKDAWRGALDEAAKAREAAATGEGAPGADPTPGLPEIPDLGTVERKLSARGSFSAFAARSLNVGGSTAEKQLKSTQRIEDDIAAIRRQAQHGGLTFA